MDDLQYFDQKLVCAHELGVLNLIINGWPSILLIGALVGIGIGAIIVLNLIINGWPSIQN